MCSLTPGSQKSATFPPYIAVGRKLGTFGFSYIVLKIGLAKLFILTLWVYSSKGQNGILGRIVSASGQIFRPDFRPQDEIFRPGMAFCPLDE